MSIPFHILIPNGICQALLPFAAGYARDRGARPAYILAFSSFLVASAPFVLTMTSGPHQVVGDSVRLRKRSAAPFALSSEASTKLSPVCMLRRTLARCGG